MNDNYGLTDILHGEKREIIEDYLIKYDKSYIGSKNKDFLINEAARQFENITIPWLRYGRATDGSLCRRKTDFKRSRRIE